MFDSEWTTIEQKRYLLDTVFSNMRLNGKILEFNLKQPFDVLANMSKTNTWCG